MRSTTAARIGIEIGAALSGGFKGVFGSANSEINKIGGSIKSLEARQKELNKVIADQEKLGRGGSPLKALYATQEIDQITRKLERLRQEQVKLNAARSGMDRGRDQMAGAGVRLGAVVAAGATLGLPISQAAAFETAMLGVAKQVDGARDSSGKLTSVYHNMARQIQILGREIPIATNDIAGMVAAGARMGVAKDELIEFTRTSAMMASAFELPASELAEQMGKIAGLFKIPIPKIGELADAINYLDDNAISKGSDIIDFLTRTGGVAGSIKITSQQMASLGSTLLTLGERAETASTATNAMFQKLAAADKGTKKFKEALKQIGVPLQAVQKGMQTDAQGTLLKVLDAVAKLPADKRLGVLVDMFGLEHSDTIAKLATNIGEYRKQIEMVSSGKAAGSMGREFAAQLATTNAQWTITKNRITEIGVNIGTILLPPVNEFLGAIGSATSGISDFVQENKTLVGNLATVAVTLGTVYAATQMGALGIGAITFAFNALKLAMMTNPIGLALTALTVAGVLLWKNWDGVKGGLVAIWETIKTTGVDAFEYLQQKVGAVIGWLTEKTKWIFETVDYVQAKAAKIGDSIGGAFGTAKNFVTGGGSAPVGAVRAVPSGAGAGSTVNAPITINGATDPEATAKAVARELDKREREARANSRSRMIDVTGH